VEFTEKPVDICIAGLNVVCYSENYVEVPAQPVDSVIAV